MFNQPVIEPALILALLIDEAVDAGLRATPGRLPAPAEQIVLEAVRDDAPCRLREVTPDPRLHNARVQAVRRHTFYTVLL